MASAVTSGASTSRDFPLEDARPVRQRRVRISIAHSQLRDLVHSPRQRGLVYTVQGRSILQYDLRHSNASTSSVPKKTTVHTLRFSPNALAFSSSSDVYATAGSKAEIFVGSLSTPAAPETWSSQFHVPGRTISNAVLWAPLPYAPDDDSPNKLERLVISNNDETVKMYNVDTSPRRNSESRIEVAGDIRIGTPVNHASVSPDGRTLLSVGDAPFIHLHALSTHTRNVAFTSLHKVSTSTNSHPPHPSYQGLFTSAFSPCSRMFAVGSQDGVVSVWDVRYLKDRFAILRTQPRRAKKFSGIQTTQTELSRWGGLLGQGSGLLRHFASDDIVAVLGWDDEDCMGKTYGVRSLKFSHDRRGGRGVLVFSEHTSNIHIVDARTFDEETRRVINLPTALQKYRFPTESPQPIDHNEMELDNDPLPVVPRPGPGRPTGPQRTVTIVDLPTPDNPTPAPRSPRLAPSRGMTSPASPIDLLSPTTTQPDSDSEVALRAIENLIVHNLASEPIHRRDLGLPFYPLPPTPSPPHQLDPFTLSSQPSTPPRHQERPVPVESQFLEALQRYRNSLVSPLEIPITSRQATSSPQALPSPPLVGTRRPTGVMPILGPGSTLVAEPTFQVMDSLSQTDLQPSFPTDLRESINNRTGSGSNTPGEPHIAPPSLRRTNDSTLPELEAAVLAGAQIEQAVRLGSIPTYESMLANLDAGVQRLELLRRQRMEMQARYNSAPRLQSPSVLASSIASPGPSPLQAGHGASTRWSPERTSEWDRLLSEQDDRMHRNSYAPTERDRPDRRPLIQHRTPNLSDPVNNAEVPVHGAELRRRRTIRVAHDPHIVWEEPRVVNSTRKPVLDYAAREWSPEDVALLDQWEEMQCDITGFSFCDGEGGEGSDWLYVGTQGRILEFRGLGLGPLLDDEEDETDNGARSDLWARRWS